MDSLIYWLDIFGIVVFAFSGALMAGRHKLDPFGVVVLATVTAIGGGTVRDIILGAYPVVWVARPDYLLMTFVTAVLTIVLIRKPKRIPHRFLLVADAFGLALFAVLGTQKALLLGAPVSVSIVMGTITGVVGGIIRDIICNEIPLILRQEIYATAALLGSGMFAILYHLEWPEHLAMILAVTSALILRLAGIFWKVSLPAFQIDDTK